MIFILPLFQYSVGYVSPSHRRKLNGREITPVDVAGRKDMIMAAGTMIIMLFLESVTMSIRKTY